MKKETLKIGVDVKQCKNCEYNLKCDECYYKCDYEDLQEKNYSLNQKLSALDREACKLKKDLDLAKLTVREIKAAAIKEFILNFKTTLRLKFLRTKHIEKIVDKIAKEMGVVE